MAMPGEPEGEARSGYASTVDENLESHWNSFSITGGAERLSFIARVGNASGRCN